MELQFLTVHEEGASQKIQRRKQSIPVVLILQAPAIRLRQIASRMPATSGSAP